LPLIAGVFYAFAAPEYKFVQAENNSEVSNAQQTLKTVKGKVIKEDGSPLKGTSIVVSGSTIGTLSWDEGKFSLEVPDDSPIVFSFVGFESVKVKPDFNNEMVITMKQVVNSIDAVGNEPSDSEIFRTSGPVLTFVDGKETSEEDLKKINPDQFESISVLKKKEFTDKYGEKGKNGVVLITLKKANAISKIGNIIWVNNTIYTSAKLNEALGMKEGEEYSKEKVKERIFGEVASLYLDNGYLFNNIQITEIPKDESTTDLKFTIFEGNSFKMGKIEIKGNKTVATSDILNKIAIKSGDLFSRTKLIQSVRDLATIDKLDPEKIMPEVNPQLENVNNEFRIVDLVFNVTEK
jgi:outer membrane protein assembly factor BamA